MPLLYYLFKFVTRFLTGYDWRQISRINSL
jgi:hypothetical protein